MFEQLPLFTIVCSSQLAARDVRKCTVVGWTGRIQVLARFNSFCVRGVWLMPARMAVYAA
jgi:hypothetical protein